MYWYRETRLVIQWKLVPEPLDVRLKAQVQQLHSVWCILWGSSGGVGGRGRERLAYHGLCRAYSVERCSALLHQWDWLHCHEAATTQLWDEDGSDAPCAPLLALTMPHDHYKWRRVYMYHQLVPSLLLTEPAPSSLHKWGTLCGCTFQWETSHFGPRSTTDRKIAYHTASV